MKKIIFTLISLLTVVTNVKAMTYEQARDEALFLTDKMAYELNLNERQYEAAYEINLDYLMGVNTANDLYGDIWYHRNSDLRYVLLDWQYNAFCAASYFYRPLYWSAGLWHFAVYAHYPHRNYFYFSRPACYVSYRGGHTWRHNGGVSWYRPRIDHYRGGGHHVGMRDNHLHDGGAVRHERPAHRDGGAGYRSPGRDQGHVGQGNPDRGRAGSYSGSSRPDGRSARSDAYQSKNGGRPSSTRITVNHNNDGGRSNFSPGRSGGADRGGARGIGGGGGATRGGGSHGGGVSHGGGRR